MHLILQCHDCYCAVEEEPNEHSCGSLYGCSLYSLSGTLVVSGICPGMCPPAVSLKHHNRESLLIVFSLSNNLLFVPITIIKGLLS